MGRDYDAAADEARDVGVIDPYHVDREQIRNQLTSFLKVEDTHAAGASKLLNETTRAVMDQEVEGPSGETVGKRRDLSTWVDTWGNVMYRNRETEQQGKLVDSDDI